VNVVSNLKSSYPPLSSKDQEQTLVAPHTTKNLLIHDD